MAASPEWREARIHLVLAGDGPAMPALREMRAASPDLERRVVLCGPVPRGEIESALAAFDVAVQPAVTSYACPMKILEYMAAGRAIVAPGSANVRELLTHGETALLCPGGANPDGRGLGRRRAGAGPRCGAAGAARRGRPRQPPGAGLPVGGERAAGRGAGAAATRRPAAAVGVPNEEVTPC